MGRLFPAVLLLASAGLGAASTPDEPSLLQAWEAVQRQDPQTRVFERSGERSYKFETSRFPYKGLLKVLNVSIDEMGGLEYTIGTVEVELSGIGPDFLRKHSASYGRWAQTHTLFFDHDKGLWLGFKEFQAAARQRQSSPWQWLQSSGALWWILFLGIFLFLLSRQVKKASSAQDKVLTEHEKSLRMMERSLQLSEQSVRLNEESNRLLQRIADSLNKG